MSDKNEVNLFILKVGAVIGLSFAATIFIAHLRGMTHTPGDNISWLNIIIFSFVVMLSGRQYRETVEGEKFNYGRALLYVSKLNVISATVLAVFGYFYYTSIAPDDLQSLIGQIEPVLRQQWRMNDEQTAVMMQLYNESLSGGSMAFVMLVMQLIGAGFFSLILANIIKTKPLLQINNLNQ
ncbi:MAG: DUF4199 domain-containing protein [Salinivirgaceae bacterium]|nr:DUF4199 domain-containing protein [Salinivirgaceae bacterium]